MFIQKSPSIQYYNPEVVNKTNAPIRLTYIDNRSRNLLNNSDDYYMSILRFDITLTEVPFMIWPNTEYNNFTLSGEDYNVNTVDNSYYSITIDDGAGSFDTQFLVFESFDITRPEPYIWNPSHFCQIINKAIRTACDNLSINIKVPYFTYRRDEGVIDWTAPDEYRNVTVGHRTLYLNRNLYNLFNAFPCTVQNIDEARYVRLDVFADGIGNNGPSIGEITQTRDTVINGATYSGQRMKSYFPNLGNMCAIRGIVFTSNTLNVIPEYTTNNSDLQSDSSNNYIKVVKDFKLSIEERNAILTTGYQNFRTSSEFEYIELKGAREALNDIEIQAYWQDNHLRLHPLYLPPNGTFSMKIQFFKKD